jgi:hypothetical protein
MESLGTLGMTIAASAVAILTPFLKKGAERFAEEIGKSIEESGGEAGKRVGEIVVDKTKKLFDKLKQKLSGNEEATMNLRLLEKDPENEAYAQSFQKVLAKELDKDKSFAEELDKQIKEIKQSNPQVKAIVERAEAETMTAIRAKSISGGSNVEAQIRDSKATKDMKGIDVDEIG